MAIESARDPQPPSSDALLEILAEEFLEAFRRGERPSISSYVARHGELADEIRDLFPTIVAMEQAKSDSAAAFPVDPGGVPAVLGDFRVLREVGRGGMGVVYEALQESLQRRVALKVLPPRGDGADRQRQQLLREGQAAARLQHPNVVQVYGLGQSQGVDYIVMQFIEGAPVDRLLKQRRRSPPDEDRTAGSLRHLVPSLLHRPAASDPTRGGCDETTELAAATGQEDAAEPGVPPSVDECREAARIAAQAADALHYAHGQGVLHRDVKPGNLLLDAAGTVWVADFGLAKFADQQSATGNIAGTLRYMPPEHLSGQATAQGDIYALGLTLYEMTTLRPAFSESDPRRLMDRIVAGEPPAPRTWNPGIPLDLETIILKSAAADPAHRYATAGELAEDLRRFLDDRPVAARPVGEVERLYRWGRRNPVLSGLGLAVGGLLLLVAVVATTAFFQVRSALQVAQTERDRVREKSELAVAALDQMFDELAPSRLPGRGFSVDSVDGAEVSVTFTPTVTPRVAQLLERMLAYYERLDDAEEDRPALRLRTAEAHRRVGDIYALLGRTDKALAAYARGEAVLAALAAAAETAVMELPPGTDLPLRQAQFQNARGAVLQGGRQFAAADAAFRSAIKTLSDADETPPRIFELARSLILAGSNNPLPPGPVRGGPPIRPPGGRGPGPGPPPVARSPRTEAESERLAKLNRAIGLLEGLTRDEPRVAEYRYLLAWALRELDARNGPSATDDETSPSERAITILEALVEQQPGTPAYRHQLILAYEGLDIRGPKGDDPVTRQRLEQGYRLAGELVREYPQAPEYVAAQSLLNVKYAEWLHDRRELRLAEKIMDEAISRLSQLVLERPRDLASRLSLLRAVMHATRIKQDQGDPLAAVDTLTAALAVLDAQPEQGAEAANPRPPEIDDGPLAHAYEVLASLQEDRGRLEAAEKSRERADRLRPWPGHGFGRRWNGEGPHRGRGGPGGGRNFGPRRPL